MERLALLQILPYPLPPRHPFLLSTGVTERNGGGGGAQVGMDLGHRFAPFSSVYWPTSRPAAYSYRLRNRFSPYLTAYRTSFSTRQRENIRKEGKGRKLPPLPGSRHPKNGLPSKGYSSSRHRSPRSHGVEGGSRSRAPRSTARSHPETPSRRLPLLRHTAAEENEGGGRVRQQQRLQTSSAPLHGHPKTEEEKEKKRKTRDDRKHGERQKKGSWQRRDSSMTRTSSSGDSRSGSGSSSSSSSTERNTGKTGRKSVSWERKEERQEKPKKRKEDADANREGEHKPHHRHHLNRHQDELKPVVEVGTQTGKSPEVSLSSPIFWAAPQQESRLSFSMDTQLEEKNTEEK